MTVEIFTEKNRWNGKVEWGAYVSDCNGFVKDGQEGPVLENQKRTEEVFKRKLYMTVCHPDYTALKSAVEGRFKVEMPETVSVGYGKSLELHFNSDDLSANGTDGIPAGCTVWAVVNSNCEDGRYAVEGVYATEEKAKKRVSEIQASGSSDSYVYRAFKVC